MASEAVFAPSPWLLGKMIESAEARFEAAREQTSLQQEARELERMERVLVAETKARHYRRIQHGD